MADDGAGVEQGTLDKAKPPVLETERLRFYGELDGVCEGLGRVYE